MTPQTLVHDVLSNDINYKLLLLILRLSRNIHFGPTKELDHAIFECILAGAPRPNREEAFDKRLQISCFNTGIPKTPNLI